MKKSLIVLAAVALTGCATSQDKYYEAVKAREDRMAVEENRIDAQIAAMGASGDATAKGMAIMYFAQKRNATPAVGQIAAPQNQALEWARLLLNPLVTIYGINRNTQVQQKQIEAETQQYGATMGTIQGIATGAFNNPTYLPMQPSETPTYLPVTPGTQSLRPVEATPTTP
jgi:hypothetical protein